MMPGQNDQLWHAGIIDMLFRRVPCNFPGMEVSTYVPPGTNTSYLSVLVQYENSNGTMVKMDHMCSRNDRPTMR
jgi:hypothetical protein